MDLSSRIRMQELARRWTAAQPAVSAFVHSVIPQYELADEILQRTAATLVNKFEEYDPERPFAGWAIGIARIEILRERDARHREQQIVTFNTETLEATAAGFSRTAAELATIQSAIDQCIQLLHGKVLEIFRLAHLDELAPADIAARVGRKPNAVIVALHRGRTAVRECLRKRLSLEGRVSL